MENSKDRQLLLNVLGSLTFCENSGDIWDVITTTFEIMGIDDKDYEEDDYRNELERMGATTLWSRGLIYGE